MGEPWEGFGDAIKNFGLWYWDKDYTCWNLLGIEDSDGPSCTFYMTFGGISRLLIVFYGLSGYYFGIAIVVSNLFSSAAFFSNSILRSSSGCSWVLLKFSIRFSSSIVLSTSVASFLHTCFSRYSSSLWSHLQRFWFYSYSSRSNL